MTETQDQVKTVTAPCRWCGSQVRRINARGVSRRDFCSQRCSDKWWARARSRGGQAYRLLIEWRTTRGGRKGVMGDLAALVDGWIQEDRQ